MQYQVCIADLCFCLTGEYVLADCFLFDLAYSCKLLKMEGAGGFQSWKHDISDVVGILREQAHSGNPLNFAQIEKAVCELYDGWEKLPEGALEMLKSILAEEDLDALYESYAQEETEAKDVLLTFEEKYPKVLQEDNLADILSHLMGRTENRL